MRNIADLLHLSPNFGHFWWIFFGDLDIHKNAIFRQKNQPKMTKCKVDPRRDQKNPNPTRARSKNPKPGPTRGQKNWPDPSLQPTQCAELTLAILLDLANWKCALPFHIIKVVSTKVRRPLIIISPKILRELLSAFNASHQNCFWCQNNHNSGPLIQLPLAQCAIN